MSSVSDPAPSPPVERVRKAKGQGGERRQEILDHALRLFVEHGVDEVSTRKIAQAVGVSQPTLYAYFPTKDAILEEVCERAFEELTQRMRAILAEAAPADRLTALGRAYIQFGLERPDAYRIAFMLEEHGRREHDHDPGAPKAGMACFEVAREAVAERLGADHPDIETASQIVWAAQHGLVSLLLAREGFPWVDRDRLIERHLRVLGAGFAAVFDAPA